MNNQNKEKNLNKLEGKTFVIFGATGGIGEGLTKGLFEAGAKLALGARNSDNLLKLKIALGNPKNVVSYGVDAGKLERVADFLATADKNLGPIDAVINTVGTWQKVNRQTELEEAAKNFQALVEGILQPTFNIGFAAQQYFANRGKGTIINLSSWVAEQPDLPDNVVYRGVKVAGEVILESLRREWFLAKKPSLRIVNLRPALVDTPENRRSFPNLAAEEWKKAVQPAALAEFIVNHFDQADFAGNHFFPSQLVV
jgi:gluconate 5-dehydrogenase